MSGYFSTSGHLIHEITIGTTDFQSDKTRIRVQFSGNDTVASLTPALANQLLALLAQRLYDDGTMTRDTADQVNHLTNVVLMDQAEYAEIVAMHSGEDY